MRGEGAVFFFCQIAGCGLATSSFSQRHVILGVRAFLYGLRFLWSLLFLRALRFLLGLLRWLHFTLSGSSTASHGRR